VRVPAYPDRIFPGTVAHLNEVLDPATHTVKVRCVVRNPDTLLKPEMYAKVELADPGNHKAILLPSNAILTDGDRTTVLVATEGNIYQRRIVDTGPEIDGKVRILAGITPGEKIVTDGAIFLKRSMQSEETGPH